MGKNTNTYKVLCPVNCNNDPKCNACGGRGYNIVIFKDGKRVK